MILLSIDPRIFLDWDRHRFGNMVPFDLAMFLELNQGTRISRSTYFLCGVPLAIDPIISSVFLL